MCSQRGLSSASLSGISRPYSWRLCVSVLRPVPSVRASLCPPARCRLVGGLRPARLAGGVSLPTLSSLIGVIPAVLGLRPSYGLWNRFVAVYSCPRRGFTGMVLNVNGNFHCVESSNPRSWFVFPFILISDFFGQQIALFTLHILYVFLTFVPGRSFV